MMVHTKCRAHGDRDGAYVDGTSGTLPIICPRLARQSNTGRSAHGVFALGTYFDCAIHIAHQCMFLC
jgi:hypothetical protein